MTRKAKLDPVYKDVQAYFRAKAAAGRAHDRADELLDKIAKQYELGAVLPWTTKKRVKLVNPFAEKGSHTIYRAKKFSDIELVEAK